LTVSAVYKAQTYTQDIV